MAHKRRGREHRATHRLITAVPEIRDLLARAAERGTNLGAMTVGLSKLLDAYGAPALKTAVVEVLCRDTPHVAGVRQALDRAAHAAGLPPPIPVALPPDPRVQNLVVRPHALRAYDALKPETDHD